MSASDDPPPDGEPGDDPPSQREPSHEPPREREQLLVRRAVPLVQRVAEQVSREFYGRVKPEVLWSPGTFGAYRAARTYRDEMNHDFTDYAFRRIRDAMLAAVDVELFHDRVRRAAIRSADDLAAHYRDDTWNPVEHDQTDARRGVRRFFMELMAAAFTGAIEEARRIQEDVPRERDAAYQHAMDALAAALKKLDGGELKMISLVYRRGEKIEDASGLLEVSYATARRWHKSGLLALREELEKAGVTHMPELVPRPDDPEIIPPVPPDSRPPKPKP